MNLATINIITTQLYNAGAQGHIVDAIWTGFNNHDWDAVALAVSNAWQNITTVRS